MENKNKEDENQITSYEGYRNKKDFLWSFPSVPVYSKPHISTKNKYDLSIL